MVVKSQTLTQAATGNTMRICSFDSDGCKQLRDMGFCEKLKVTKLSNGRNIVCVTCGTKLVLNRKLADQIQVCPV